MSRFFSEKFLWNRVFGPARTPGSSRGRPRLEALEDRLAPASLIISEFRLRGPNGANDEFVEIHNTTGADLTVNTTDGSTGFAVAASNGLARFIIPNGTVIPAFGHYL